MKRPLLSEIRSAFPKTARRPLRKVAPGGVISAREVNRWIEAINTARQEEDA